MGPSMVDKGRGPKAGFRWLHLLFWEEGPRQLISGHLSARHDAGDTLCQEGSSVAPVSWAGVAGRQCF